MTYFESIYFTYQSNWFLQPFLLGIYSSHADQSLNIGLLNNFSFYENDSCHTLNIQLVCLADSGVCSSYSFIPRLYPDVVATWDWVLRPHEWFNNPAQMFLGHYVIVISLASDFSHCLSRQNPQTMSTVDLTFWGRLLSTDTSHKHPCSTLLKLWSPGTADLDAIACLFVEAA